MATFQELSEEIRAGMFLARAVYGDSSISDAFDLSSGPIGRKDDYQGYLASQGWNAKTFASLNNSFAASNNGLYEKGDAQALVAEGYVDGQRTLVLAFRGTDALDPALTAAQTWTASGQADYYELLRPLVLAIHAYVSEAVNGIHKVIVSGHSLGGSMVDFFSASDARLFKESGTDLTAVSIASPGLDPDLFSGNGTIDLFLPNPQQITPSDFYVGISHSQDRVYNAERIDDAPFSRLNPNFILGGNREFPATVFDVPRIENLDVNYAVPSWMGKFLYPVAYQLASLYTAGFGAEHNSGLYWANVEALTRDPLLKSWNSHNLIFGIADYSKTPDYSYNPITNPNKTLPLFEGYSGLAQFGNDNDEGTRSISGTAKNEYILGLTGDDRIEGFGGEDLLSGGSGDDVIYGGLARDILHGGSGKDTLYGDENADILNGGAGNDVLDGGLDFDTAKYAGSFRNYKIVSLGSDRYTVQDLRSGSPDGIDTLERIEQITFSSESSTGTETLTVAQWITKAGGGTPPANPSPTQNTPYIPTSSNPDTPDGVANSLLSVTPVNKQLTTGQSVALSELFPSSSWIDNDGGRDIVRFAVQDRSAGGGYLTHNGKAVAPNIVHEMPISDLANWRFVAGSAAAVDQIGFNIIQADGDFSPRLPTGAVVTTVSPVIVKPSNPTPITVSGTEITRLDLDLRNGDSGDEGDSAQFTIQRRGNQDGDIVLQWHIEGIGDNPADRRDFSAMTGTVTLLDGRGDRNFSIGITQDQVDEFNERFNIELTVVSGNAVFDDDNENFTIIDDDIPLGINPNVDDHGNSFATATIVAEDRWARGFIEQPGDQDYFRFELLGGVGYDFILIKDDDLSLIGGDPNASFPRLPQPIGELYNASGQLIATLPATNLSINWSYLYETPSDGTYYLRVRENGDNDVGQYFVQADIRVPADDFAANSTTVGILAAENSTMGHHERENDVDWIAVDLVAGEKYRFSLFDENRVLVDGTTGGVNGGNGWYYFGLNRADFRLVDSSGASVSVRTSGYPTSSNLIEFEATQSGRFYVAVDGSADQMYNYVVNFDHVAERPAAPALVLQPASDAVTDLRFNNVRDSNSVAIDDELLTVNNNTSSAIKFDLSSVTATANYAAIEVFLVASDHVTTGDIAVDVPGAALSEASKFGDIGSIEFLTAVQTSGVGKWVTIDITDLYNQWITGERENNGIVLSTTETTSALLSFYSSSYAANPSLRPRLVLEGPDFTESVFGQTTGTLTEDQASVSGSIGMTGGTNGFSGAVASGSLGTITVDDTGRTWSYELDARAEELRQGQLFVENLVLTSSTGLSQTISITVTGTDDAAVVIGPGAFELTEAIRTISGRAAIADIDALVAPTYVESEQSGTYGLFSILTDGSWTYSLSDAGALALKSGMTGTEQVTVTASDGTRANFEFSIIGEDSTTGGGSEPIVGTSASDIIFSRLGSDILIGGLGADRFAGSAEQLDGDTITDFSIDDEIYLVDAIARIDRFSNAINPQKLNIDANKDGDIDAVITLTTPLSGGEFMAVPSNGGTVFTYEKYLSDLSETRAVSAEEVNGIANQHYLTAATDTAFEVTVNPDAQAGFHNSLGVYEVTEDGVITNVRIVFDDVKESEISPVTVSGVGEGNRLCFFIVQDGATWANNLQSTDTLSFIREDGSMFDALTGGVSALAVNGLASNQTVFHSLNETMNVDGVEHVLSGVDVGGDTMTLGFEDLLGGGDRDFQDVIIRVARLDGDLVIL
jgi:VCBS repeat-containing protein